MSPPSSDVLAGFGVSGQPQALAGGQQPVWRVEDLVFKQLDCPPRMLAWQAKLLGRVGPAAGVRVAPPIPDLSGAWSVQGWTASRFMPGRPAGHDWQTIMTAGNALHLALSGEQYSDLVEARDDVWARADRAVWDLAAAPPHPALRAAFEARSSLELPNQLVHGDLTGNVLISDGEAPAVLDFSPYWRPAPWATAVVCVDALLGAHANGRRVLTDAQVATGNTPSGQILLRAVLFRLVTAVLTGCDPRDNPAHLRTLRRIVRHAAPS